MEVGGPGKARLPHTGDRLTPSHVLSRAHEGFLAVGVKGCESIGVEQHDGVAVAGDAVVRVDHETSPGGDDVRAFGGTDIDAFVRASTEGASADSAETPAHMTAGNGESQARIGVETLDRFHPFGKGSFVHQPPGCFPAPESEAFGARLGFCGRDSDAAFSLAVVDIAALGAAPAGHAAAPPLRPKGKTVRVVAKPVGGEAFFEVHRREVFGAGPALGCRGLPVRRVCSWVCSR